MLLVPKAGLEPARISTVDFESTASTDFATPARKGCGKRCGLYLYLSPVQPQLSVLCAKCRKFHLSLQTILIHRLSSREWRAFRNSGRRGQSQLADSGRAVVDAPN